MILILVNTHAMAKTATKDDDSGNGPPPKTKNRINGVNDDSAMSLDVSKSGRIRGRFDLQLSKSIIKWLTWAIAAAVIGWLSTLIPMVP